MVGMLKRRYFQIRLTDEELEQVKKAAEAMGLSASEYARMVLKTGSVVVLDEKDPELAMKSLGRLLLAQRDWRSST